MFREQSLTGLGKEARNVVLTFTWLFYYAIIVTLSSSEGNLQAFSSASSPSSVTIYNLPLFPLKVNVISLSPSSPHNLYHTKSSVCAFWQGQLLQACCRRPYRSFDSQCSLPSLPLCMLPACSSQSLPCPLFFDWHVLYAHVGSDLLYFKNLFSNFRKFNFGLFSGCSFPLVISLVH